MKKILGALLISAAMCGTACFAEGLNPKQPVINNDGASVIIEGVYEAGRRVNIMILNAGKSITDLTGEEHSVSGQSAALYAADELKCDSDGEFGAEYSMENKSQGKYNVYYSTANEFLNKSFWYVESDTLDGWVEEIQKKSDSSEIEKYLFTETDALGDGTMVKRAELMGIDCTDASFNEFLSVFLANSKSVYSDLTGFNKTATLAKNAYKLKNGSVSDITDENKKLTAVIWDAEDNMTAILSIYNETLSNDGRGLVLDDMKASDVASAASFKEAFAKACAVRAINNAKTQGFGHINGVITEVNKLVTMDTGKYMSLDSDSRSKVDSLLLNTSITSFTSLCDYIKTYSNSQSSSNTVLPSTTGKVTTSLGGSIFTNNSNKTENNQTSNEVNNEVFKDLSDYAWAKDAIMELYEKKIASGVSEKEFEPGRSVTREEFLKMLICALNIELSENKSGFNDVDENEWYAKYIATAKEMGLTTGKVDGSFGIGENITREDCCVFIARANALTGDGQNVDFKDKELISEYALTSVAAVRATGIVKGDDNNLFNPQGLCTRAEAAVMISRMLAL